MGRRAHPASRPRSGDRRPRGANRIPALGGVTALIASAIAAVYPPLIYSGTSLLTEPLSTVLLLCGIAAILRYRRDDGEVRWLVVAGLCAGFAHSLDQRGPRDRLPRDRSLDAASPAQLAGARETRARPRRNRRAVDGSQRRRAPRLHPDQHADRHWSCRPVQQHRSRRSRYVVPAVPRPEVLRPLLPGAQVPGLQPECAPATQASRRRRARPPADQPLEGLRLPSRGRRRTAPAGRSRAPGDRRRRADSKRARGGDRERGAR